MIDHRELPGTHDRTLALGGRRLKQLFEILLSAEGRVVPRDELARRLWGDELPRHVESSLASYVAVLRNRLEPGVPPEESVVAWAPDGYCFTLADHIVRAG